MRKWMDANGRRKPSRGLSSSEVPLYTSILAANTAIESWKPPYETLRMRR